MLVMLVLNKNKEVNTCSAMGNMTHENERL